MYVMTYECFEVVRIVQVVGEDERVAVRAGVSQWDLAATAGAQQEGRDRERVLVQDGLVDRRVEIVRDAGVAPVEDTAVRVVSGRRKEQLDVRPFRILLVYAKIRITLHNNCC